MQELSYISPRSYLARFAVAVVVYGGPLVVSFNLVPPGGAGTSLVWPPAALGFVLLFFGGPDLWRAMAVLFFFVLSLRGVYPPLIAATAVGNVAESLIAAYILKR